MHPQRTILICTAAGCTNRHNARGLCSTHYLKLWKAGLALPARRSLEERFWSKVRKTDGCWLWLASTNPAGYGVIGVEGKNQLAHRLSYAMAYGPIPPGLNVLHHCDNPGCVKPPHLFLGTHADNVADMRAKDRHGGAHRYGAAYSTRIRLARAKLTWAQVCVIRERYAAGGTTYRKLATAFNCDKTNIAHIVTYQSWREDHANATSLSGR